MRSMWSVFLGSLAAATWVLFAPSASEAQFRNSVRFGSPVISLGNANPYTFGAYPGYAQPYGMYPGYGSGMYPGYTYGGNGYGAAGVPGMYGSGGMPGALGFGAYGMGMGGSAGFTGATANYFFAPSAGAAPRYRSDYGGYESGFVGPARVRADVSPGTLGYGYGDIHGYGSGCGYGGGYGGYVPYLGSALPERMAVVNRQAPSLYGVPITVAGTARAAPGSAAQIEVRLPKADAELYFEGTKIESTGTLRRFPSPRLASGASYVYDVEARWLENGKTQTSKTRLQFQAGETRTVDFTTGLKIKPLEEETPKKP